MAKISNKKKYPEQEIVNKKDYVIGTDYYDRKKTKTFPIANLAQVLADILIEDGGIHIDVGKTSQLINDGEFGDSRFVEESELEVIIQDIKDNLHIYELKDNKQNNLNPDGTGTKYPTVDAVNTKVQELEDSISNVSGDKTYVHEQTIPSKVWEYEHGLNKKPSVQITDSAGSVLMGQVTVNDGIKVRIEFNIAFWGYATNN